MLIEHHIKVILATVIIVTSWAIAAQSFAADAPAEKPVWLWSEAAPLSSAAAEAFSGGDLGRGLRLSKSALAQAESRHARFIAHHNMCIAHALQGHQRSADRHCQESRRLAAVSYRVVNDNDGIAVADVLDRNLASVGYPTLRN